MSVNNDTLKEELTPSAQAIGDVFMRMALSIEITNDIYDPLSKSKEIATEWAVQGTQISTDALAEYIENDEYLNNEEVKKATTRYFDALKTFQKMYEPYEELMHKLTTKRNRIYFVREETEQNAWRMAYFIKELRMSELQKRHNEPIDNEQMLLENLTPDDMESIQQSYNHIAIGLATIYAWHDFITFLSEYFKNARLAEAIEQDAPNESPVQALKAEAGRTTDFIKRNILEYLHNEQLDKATADAYLNTKVEYYTPLTMYSYLINIKRTNKKSYDKITINYADCSIEEITENIEQILADFTREIMKQIEGAE